MSTDVTLFRNTQLAKADLNTYKQNLQKAQAAAPQPGGVPILKLGKDEIWRYGQKQTEVQPGSEWAVNPLSFCKGFVAWNPKGGTKPLGKQMANMLSGNLPIEAQLPDVGAPWTEAVEFELKCMTGEDTGTTVRFAANSMGGVERTHELIAQLIHQMDVDPARLVPIVTLENDGYYHANRSFGVMKNGQPGWVAKPIFNVVGWMALDGTGMTETQPEDDTQDSEPEQATPQRRAPVNGAAAAQPAQQTAAQPQRRAPVGNPVSELKQQAADPQPEAQQQQPDPVIRRRRRAAAT